MIIIVEGSDLTGKTTFVKILSELVPDASVIKSGPPNSVDDDPFLEYEHRLYEFIDNRTSVIADRFHFGERVYGPLLRNRDRLEDAGWRHVELFLASRGAVVVYLHQPSSVLMSRMDVRGDTLIERRHLVNIDVGYQWCIRNTILPTLSLRDPSYEEAEAVVNLALAREVGPSVTYRPSYVGSIQPTVLLFGEQRGGKPPHTFRSAFVPSPSTSGRYLLNALPEGFWPHLGLANSLEDDPAELWYGLDCPSAVALGRRAHDVLTSAKIDHATVPHPQFVRRFLHAQQRAYGELIQEIAHTTRQELRWRGSQQS